MMDIHPALCPVLRMGLTGGKPPPQPRNLAGHPNSPGNFGRFPGNAPGNGSREIPLGIWLAARVISREIPLGISDSPSAFPGFLSPENSPAAMSREMDFAGNPPWNSPVNYSRRTPRGIHREIWLVSREIPRKILDGQPHFPGNSPGNGGKFPGKYGPAQPVLVGYAHSSMRSSLPR